MEDRSISVVVPCFLANFFLIIDRKTFILRVLFSLVVFTFSLLKTSGDSALFRIATGPQCSIAAISNIILLHFLLLLVYKEEKRSADSLLQHFSINQPCGSSFLSTPKSLCNWENKIGRGVSFIGGTHIGIVCHHQKWKWFGLVTASLSRWETGASFCFLCFILPASVPASTIEEETAVQIYIKVFISLRPY